MTLRLPDMDTKNEVPRPRLLDRDARSRRTGCVLARRKGSLRTAGLAFVFFWFLIGGIAHFVATHVEMRIVPPYIPWPRAAVLTSGVFELLGAVGLLLPRTRRLAGIGLFVLTLAVTPAHIYMLQEPQLFPSIPVWVMWLRLPIQAALLALIAWCTSAPVRVRS